MDTYLDVHLWDLSLDTHITLVSPTGKEKLMITGCDTDLIEGLKRVCVLRGELLGVRIKGLGKGAQAEVALYRVSQVDDKRVSEMRPREKRRRSLKIVIEDSNNKDETD